MNAMEKRALQHVAEWRAYSRSAKYSLDLQIEKQNRNAITIRQKHSLMCGILKCHPSCPSLNQTNY